MKKHAIIFKVISVLLTLTLLCTIFVSCKKSEDASEKNLYDLSGFKIVRGSMTDDEIVDYAVNLKNSIKSTLGLDLTVGLDDDAASGKEIIIGDTTRQASIDALSYLNASIEEDAYVIQINEDNIVIIGKTTKSTIRGVKVFIENYLDTAPAGSSIDISSGTQIANVYNNENVIYASNGVEFDVEVISTICEAASNIKNTSFAGPDFPMLIYDTQYPSITELRYQPNEKDNGKLIAILNLSATDLSGTVGNTNACVAMSEDGGVSWKCIARPTSEFHTGLPTIGSMAHIYELPAKVGDMPAGTLLYSANSVNMSYESHISVWRSFDGGYEWEQYVTIASAGGRGEGVWEPFMMYCEEDQYLYCFYSDDSDPEHDQKVVYKRSNDGINWSESPVDVVAYDKFSFRPGMPVITKMGNGEYFIVYEQFGDSWSSCPIFYKTTTDLSNWGDQSNYGTMIKSVDGKRMTGSPACAWLDVGGECGTLVVTAKSTVEEIFVSFDYGKTWETIENPLPYYEVDSSNGRTGYSDGLWVGADGKTLYMVSAVNATNNPDNNRMIAFAKIRIY